MVYMNPWSLLMMAMFLFVQSSLGHLPNYTPCPNVIDGVQCSGYLIPGYENFVTCSYIGCQNQILNGHYSKCHVCQYDLKPVGGLDGADCGHLEHHAAENWANEVTSTPDNYQYVPSPQRSESSQSDSSSRISPRRADSGSQNDPSWAHDDETESDASSVGQQYDSPDSDGPSYHSGSDDD